MVNWRTCTTCFDWRTGPHLHVDWHSHFKRPISTRKTKQKKSCWIVRRSERETLKRGESSGANEKFEVHNYTAAASDVRRKICACRGRSLLCSNCALLHINWGLLNEMVLLSLTALYLRCYFRPFSLLLTHIRR